MAANIENETPNLSWECELPDCGNADDAKWKQKFFNKVQQRGLNLQRIKIEALQQLKAEEEKVNKNDPPDPLAREWFSTDKEKVDVRAYMLDKLLPTLVPGVEKLLMEAEKRHQLDPLETNVPKFNPVNFLAEVLMRNNPRTVTCQKTSSYTRGLKEVLKDLKSQVADVGFDRVAQLKQEMKESQEQRVQQKDIVAREKDTRKEALALQFLEWTLDISGRIPVVLIQSALKSFQEIASRSPLQSKLVSYAKDLETDETLEHKLNGEEFVEYIYSYIKDLSADLFEELLHHLSQSADVFRETIRHDRWRQMFIDLFLACDHGKVGALDRQRILLLLEAFYDNAGPEDMVWGFRNPRQWPMIEFREMDPMDFWAEFDKTAKVPEQKESVIVHPSTLAFQVSPSNTTLGPWPDFDETTKFSEPKSLLPQPSSSDLQIRLSNRSSELWPSFDMAPKDLKHEGSSTVLPISSDLRVHPSNTGSEFRRQSGSQAVHGIHSIVAQQSGGILEAAAKRQSTEGVRSVHSSEVVPAVSAERQGVDSMVAQQSIQQLEAEMKRQSMEVVSKVSAEGQGIESMVSRQISREESAVKRQSTEKVGSVEASEVVPTFSAEGHPPNSLPQENTNVNAGNDELGADPAGETTSGTPPSASQEPSTHEQDIASERRSSTPRQRSPMLIASQPRVEIPMAVQSLMTITHERSTVAGESEAEEATISQDPDAITVLEDIQQKASSLVDSPEVRDSEEQKTGDVDATKEPQYIDGIPWSGDLLTSNLTLKYGSYGNRSQDDWSVAASRFTDLRSIITDIHSWEPPHVTSAFDRNSLNLPQFVQLMETFLGEETSQSLVERLVDFIRTGYVETEEEKSQRLEKAQREAFSARCNLVLDALFKKWDNEGSGFLELSKLEATLAKYQGGINADVLSRARERLKSAYSCKGDSVRINSRDFQRFIESLLGELPGTEEEVFENLVEFLTKSVERTQIEHMRGAARRKWLHEIQRAAESCGGNIEPVYQATFQALSKDAESHGNKKKISASIGMLEQSPPDSGRSPILLRYVACTPDDAPYVLDKALYRDMKGVSFDAVDGGKPVHVPRVQYHGNVQFWKHDRPVDKRTGSYLVIPLKDSNFHVFGTLGIDTVRDVRERNIFLLHEISFYQGVANTFSVAYHYVLIRRNILLLVSSALAWIHNRAPNIQSVTTYLMEPGTEKQQPSKVLLLKAHIASSSHFFAQLDEPDYVLRKAMTTDNNTGLSETYPNPATLRRKENLFRDYLFKCADSSEVITTDAYGERHIAVPIREPSGRALAVMDICTGQCRELPAHEFQDLQKMLQMLQEACNEILEESEGETEKTFILEAERSGEESRLGVLFYRFMLQDLRECVRKLDHRSFAELKSYNEPPVMIHNILRAVLLLFNPEWAASEEVESWSQCKLKVNSNLVRMITSFDPTASTVNVHPLVIAKYIKGIPRGAVWRHGSIPAEYLYNWAFTCLSLLELNPNLPEAPNPSLVSLVPSQLPSLVPSQVPSLVPSQLPSLVPSQVPSLVPSAIPSTDSQPAA